MSIKISCKMSYNFTKSSIIAFRYCKISCKYYTLSDRFSDMMRFLWILDALEAPSTSRLCMQRLQ